MSRKHKNYSKGMIDQIIELHLKGLSSRKICDEMDLPRSRKSSINYVLKDYREGKLVHSGELKDAGKIVQEIDESVALDTLCEHPDWTISNLAKRLRTAQRTNNQLRKVQRDIFDGEDNITNLTDFSKLLSDSLASNIEPLNYKRFKEGCPTKCTVELLFSDLQIGKCSEFYNTENATKSMSYYGQECLNIVKEANPEEIVFASLGDIIECSKKHGLQSAYSTDTSNAQQLANATSLIWKEVLQPLVNLGVPITVIGCAGNHGADAGKGFDMYKAGLYTYDFVIYQSLKLLCEAAGASHITFNVPEGCFATHTIYGNTYLYEHGYFNQCTEKSMIDHKKKRMDNLKEYLHGYRCGDMHHVCLYDCSNLVVNGSFFGIEREGAEYSGILGFNAVPAQVAMIHRPLKGNNLGQSTVVDTKIIQVAKSYV